MNNKTLLIVDDETHLLAVLEFALRKVADVCTAETGFDALKILEEKVIDCVLCDINLPRMSGLELLKELRSRKIDVPFLFYTAEAGREAIEEAARLGARDYFYKPHFKGIETAIVSILSGKDYAPEPTSEFAIILEGK